MKIRAPQLKPAQVALLLSRHPELKYQPLSASFMTRLGLTIGSDLYTPYSQFDGSLIEELFNQPLKPLDVPEGLYQRLQEISRERFAPLSHIAVLCVSLALGDLT